MGKHFGDLAVVRGVLYYKLSPHEQKAFAGAIKYGGPNTISRIMDRLWTYLPTFILGYATYVAVEESYYQSKRKNPKDYMNEVDPRPPEPCADKKKKPKS